MPAQLFEMPALLDAEKIDTSLHYVKHHIMLKCVLQNYISLQTMLILKQQCLYHPKHILHLYTHNKAHSIFDRSQSKIQAHIFCINHTTLVWVLEFDYNHECQDTEIWQKLMFQQKLWKCLIFVHLTWKIAVELISIECVFWYFGKSRQVNLGHQLSPFLMTSNQDWGFTVYHCWKSVLNSDHSRSQNLLWTAIPLTK